MTDIDGTANAGGQEITPRAERDRPKPDISGKSLGYQTIWSVQDANIKPPALKLLLLNIAVHVSSQTGVAYPGVHLLAKECSLSLSHTKRLLRIAKGAGILEVVSQGGGRSSNRYRFNLPALAAYTSEPDSLIPSAVIERLRGSMGEPGSTMNPVQEGAGSQLDHEPAAGSSMNTEPQRPQRPQSLGEGGRTTPSGSASPPPWVVPALPSQLDPNLFTQLVEMGPAKQSRVNLLAQEAFMRDAAGHDLNALATDTIKRGFKSWCKPQSKPTKKEFPHQQSSPVTEAQKQHGGRHSSAKRMARNLGDETDWEMPK
jgi:hypothetical protein